MTDELLVRLFYAAQGNITRFRIKAREILADSGKDSAGDAVAYIDGRTLAGFMNPQNAHKTIPVNLRRGEVAYETDVPLYTAPEAECAPREGQPFVMCLDDVVEMWNSTVADSFEDELMEFAAKAINFYKDTLPGGAIEQAAKEKANG